MPEAVSQLSVVVHCTLSVQLGLQRSPVVSPL
jgi:hypothetical protein